MRPIMLATDGSPSAEAATHEAFDLAERLHLPLLVISVRHEMTPSYGYYGYAEVAADMRKVEHGRITELLAAIEQRAAAAGIECETLELDGVAGERLCRAAEDNDVRLIVIGAHGWGRFGRLIHGSVSNHVLHHAPVPVLVVQGDGTRVDDSGRAAATIAA